VYAYTRELDGVKMLVLLNSSAEEATVPRAALGTLGEVLINNYAAVSVEEESLALRPYQAVIYAVGPGE
jgi:oligo-1,6-glucosidase